MRPILHKYQAEIAEIFLILALSFFAIRISLLIPIVLGFVLLRIGSRLSLPGIGFITKIVIISLSFLSFNTVVGFLFWVFHLPITPNIVLIIYTLILVIVILITKKNVWGGLQSEFNLSELFALAIAIAVFFIAVLPIYHRHDGIVVSRAIANGGDNYSHLEFINVINAKQGYVQGKMGELTDVLTAKLIPYPQGWHLNLVIIQDITEAAHGYKFTLDQTLLYYYLCTAFGLSLLIFLVVRVGLFLLSGLKIDSWTQWPAATLLAFVSSTGPLFAFFTFGFQTQLMAYSIFLAELLVLYVANSRENIRTKKHLYYLALLMASGTAYVWLFIWPIALMTVGLFMIDGLNLSKKVAKREWKYVSTASSLALLGLGQVYFQLKFTHTPNINEPGFIIEPNNFLLLSVLGMSFLFVLYSYAAKPVRMLGQVLGGSAVFSLLVLGFQLYTASEPRYFYFKSTYTFFILSLILMACAIAIILTKIMRQIKRGPVIDKAVIILIILITLGSFAWTLTSKQFRFYIGKQPYGMSEELADAVLTVIKKDPKDGHRVIAIGSCNREQDIKAMRMAVSLSGDPELLQQEVLESQVASSSARKTFDHINDYLEAESGLYIISTDENIRKRLQQYLGARFSDIKYINLDYSKKEKSLIDCPNLLR